MGSQWALVNDSLDWAHLHTPPVMRVLASTRSQEMEGIVDGGQQKFGEISQSAWGGNVNEFFKVQYIVL